MSYIGSTKIGKLYLGAQEINKAYLGNTLVFQKGGGPTPPGPDPGDLSNYVQDGLVMHLDGKQKGNTSGRWESLVGTTYFTLNTHSTEESDCVLMDGSGYLTATNPYTTTYSTGTIEVCAENYSSGSAAILFGPSGRLVFIIAGSGYTFGLSNSNNQWNITKQSLFTVSANAVRFMLNGVVGGTKGSNGWAPQSSGITMGGRTAGTNHYYANARIYSIRVYSRQLSEAEMLQNAKVDNARFNLGLSI